MSKVCLLASGCLVAVSCLLLRPPTALAQVPPLIRYQGQAVDAKGVPLEGPYTLTFRLYSAETAGTKLWEEVQPNIPLSKGHFSVLLGSVTPLTGMDWSQPCWLAIQVNTEPELAPRQQITSVPLAITAEQLATPIATSAITDDAKRLVPTGAIILWRGATCPSGYTRVAAWDGAMLKAGSVATGPVPSGPTELPAHSHGAGSYTGPEHTHNIWTDVNIRQPLQSNGIAGNYTYNAEWKTVMIQPAGAGPVTGTSASAGSGTVVTVVLCQKD